MYLCNIMAVKTSTKYKEIMQNRKIPIIKKVRGVLLIFSLYLSCFLTPNSFADGIPHRWQIGLQKAQSPVMHQITIFHDFLLWIQAIVAAVVAGLLAYILYRFRTSKNKNPSKKAHNTGLEIAWTLIPLVLILYMMYPSLKLIYFMDVVPKSEMTLKAVGHQWYWSYEYPDQEDISFDSYMIKEKDLKPGQVRLLSTDNPVYLPIATTIRILTTSADVIHSWTLPSLGIKKDSVPGRLNEVWLRINKEGTYFGQCSELCGPGHAFMPIEIRAVSPKDFEKWVKEKKKK